MFHGRTVNKKKKHLHERVLQIVYKDFTSFFEDLLKGDNCVTTNITDRFRHKYARTIPLEIKNAISVESFRKNQKVGAK